MLGGRPQTCPVGQVPFEATVQIASVAPHSDPVTAVTTQSLSRVSGSVLKTLPSCSPPRWEMPVPVVPTDFERWGPASQGPCQHQAWSHAGARGPSTPQRAASQSQGVAGSSPERGLARWRPGTCLPRALEPVSLFTEAVQRGAAGCPLTPLPFRTETSWRTSSSSWRP